MNCVYILSPSFSGSTLLTFLLATHPEVATVGELKASAMGDIDLYNCSCGTRIRECEFWKQLSDALARSGTHLDFTNFGTHFRCLDYPFIDRILRARVRGQIFETARKLAVRCIPRARSIHRSILERNKVCVEAITRMTGAKVFLDGSKDPARLKFFASAGYWPIKTIHLLRDGRATAASYMKHHGMTMEVAAAEWRRTHEECENLKKQLPQGSWLTIQYENLCHNPDQTLETLFRFIELPPALATRAFQSTEQHLIGNAMRLNKLSEITLDEKWRTELDHEGVATFARVAGKLNSAYGYV